MKESVGKTRRAGVEQKLRTYMRTKEAVAIMEDKLARLKTAEMACRSGTACARERTKIREERERMEVLIGLNRIEMDTIEKALERLNKNERLIVDAMLIAPVPDALDMLCETMNVETATVYRRRRSALEKLTAYLQ